MDDVLVRRPASALTLQANVLGALILRDMRTRFGGSHWGYVITVGWPCAHIFTLVALLTLRGVTTPIGDSATLFVATGTTPYITFMYMSRKVMEGIVTNKPLTYFPAVSVLDIILSRLIVETITAFATTACVLAILIAIGVDGLPIYPSDALFAYFATILIAGGMGIINANIFAYFPGWAMGYVLIIIGGYSASGVFFLPELLPEKAYYYLSWNPMLQCISWFRSAFYPGYGQNVAKLYTVLVGLFLTGLGLAIERFVTRRRMQGF